MKSIAAFLLKIYNNRGAPSIYVVVVLRNSTPELRIPFSYRRHLPRERSLLQNG